MSAFRNLLHHHVHQQAAGPATTFWAGLGAVRREAFLASAGFDAERYPVPSIEDIELGMRLAPTAARIGLDPRDPGHAPEALDACGAWCARTSPSAAFPGFGAVRRAGRARASSTSAGATA